MNIESLLNWIETHQSILVFAGFFSLITVISAALAVPFIINSLSVDYFIKKKRRSSIETPLKLFLLIVTLIIKNILGLLLFISGFLMLFVPGQGLLTIFISFLFIDFPGKWKFQQRIVKIPNIHKVLNWIRKKGGKPEFIIPHRF